jgi:hypothetical protein
MNPVDPEIKAGRRRSRRVSLKGGMLVGQMGPLGGSRRRRRSRTMEGGSYYGVVDAGSYPGTELADNNAGSRNLGPNDTPQPIKGGVQTAGRRRRGSSKTRKSSKGKRPMSPWLQHVMAVKKANPSFSLGDAMKEAKKTYKK